MTLWLWSMLITFVLSALAGILTIVWTVKVSPNLTRTSMLGSSFAELVAVILNMFVVWRITTPNPAHQNQDPDARLRQVTRAGAIMAFISLLGVILFLLSDLPKIYMYVSSIIGMGGWVSYVGILLYLREFACRVPNRKFIRSITVIMWWLCSATLILQLFGFGYIWLMDLDSTQTPVASSPGTPITQTPVESSPDTASTQTPVASSPGTPTTQTPVASSSVAVSTFTPGAQPPLAYSCSTGLVGLVSFGFTIWLVVALFRLRAAFRRALDDVEHTLAVEQP